MNKLKITTNKNLLAFSGGVDSTALFFLLLQQNISFDIAIVNYSLRESSNEEVAYAKELAVKYNKRIYTSSFPKDTKFSEKIARDFRYSFFEKIIEDDDYNALITAHQLNDKLEWFLMQLSKGAGVVELMGMKEAEIRDDIHYLKPLLNTSKKELLEYLQTNKIKYFVDESNTDEKYKRNYIRVNISNFMMADYENGIKKSFEYLEKDISSLSKIVILKQNKEYYELKNLQDNLANIRAIDKILKKLGVLISSKQRDEILEKQDIVISHKFAVVIRDEIIYISPFIKVKMTKQQKEIFRKNKIPPKMRGYLTSL